MKSAISLFTKENNTNKICIIYLFSKNEISDFTFYKRISFER